jgi:NAD(P)-dependent dehydrogenase (short-subunit alcohol dehydrogenase family)
MTSSYWDEEQAERYRQFRYVFTERALEGRTVIVAGGTGGLGAATVALLAREGAKVVVGYRSNRERAQNLRRAIEQQFGQTVYLVEGDLAEPATWQSYWDAVSRAAAPLYGAVIFPGDPARARLEELDAATMELSLRANYLAPVLFAKEVGLKLEQAGTDSSLVLLASMQARAPFSSSLNYGAPKAALVHAARILAKDWSRVRVNVVAPGATVVGMAAASVGAGKYDTYRARGVISRFGRPEDIGRAVRFLLEPDNYVTGQVLVVDGGLTIRRDQA